MKSRMTDQDWIDEIAGGLVENVKCLMGVEPQLSINGALEAVLSSTCAGPLSIERAREILSAAL